jgi:hypothetical protein
MCQALCLASAIVVVSLCIPVLLCSNSVAYGQLGGTASHSNGNSAVSGPTSSHRLWQVATLQSILGTTAATSPTCVSCKFDHAVVDGEGNIVVYGPVNKTVTLRAALNPTGQIVWWNFNTNHHYSGSSFPVLSSDGAIMYFWNVTSQGDFAIEGVSVATGQRLLGWLPPSVSVYGALQLTVDSSDCLYVQTIDFGSAPTLYKLDKMLTEVWSLSFPKGSDIGMSSHSGRSSPTIDPSTGTVYITSALNTDGDRALIHAVDGGGILLWSVDIGAASERVSSNCAIAAASLQLMGCITESGRIIWLSTLNGHLQASINPSAGSYDPTVNGAMDPTSGIMYVALTNYIGAFSPLNNGSQSWILGSTIDGFECVGDIFRDASRNLYVPCKKYSVYDPSSGKDIVYEGVVLAYTAAGVFRWLGQLHGTLKYGSVALDSFGRLIATDNTPRVHVFGHAIAPYSYSSSGEESAAASSSSLLMPPTPDLTFGQDEIEIFLLALSIGGAACVVGVCLGLLVLGGVLSVGGVVFWVIRPRWRPSLFSRLYESENEGIEMIEMPNGGGGNGGDKSLSERFFYPDYPSDEGRG